MAAKEEDGNDGFLGELRDLAELMQQIISQDEVDESEKKGVGQGGENKLNSDETSNEQGTSNHQLAGLSATYNVLVAYTKSDLANLEPRNVSVSSGEAVSSLSVPSSDLASKYKLPDDEEVTNPIDYSSSDYDVVRYQLSLLSLENDDSKEYASLKQCMTKIDSSTSLDHPKAEQAHEHASDFTFDIRKPVINPAQAPPKPSLQRQNAMHRQRHTSELDPGYSASSLNQPMPTRQSITTTASSHGRRPSVSMTKALITSTEFVPQTQRNPHYSQRQVPSGQYGNITNSPYSPPNQNESYNMPPSATAFQQQGGSNMAHNGNVITFPYGLPEQNDSYNMPQYSAVSIAPYAYGSVNLFGTSSDNVAADSRFGYEGGLSRNHFSSLQQHQSGDSFVWPLSPRRSRQQRQQQLRSDFFATLNQQNDRSDPSDQTQQRLFPRDN
ncbi:uncharacterized protein LOC106416974 [Brassica napus]|uniref:uncharacterized protein LOC106416974 n=1 Tax=Brassica napus TaxID=3708 RepID=UPI0006AAC02A|nr:uncharacterized protein LOC106416974 [Brassica napus]